MADDPLSPPAAPFLIRHGTNEDGPAIRALIRAVRVEFGVLHENMDEPELNDLHASFFERGGSFLVVEDNANGIVGCAGLYPLTPLRAELGKMYVQRSARGQGLGGRLLEQLLAVARGNGFAEVWLETNSRLVDAIALYRKYGFEPVDPDHLLPKCDAAFLLRLR